MYKPRTTEELKKICILTLMKNGDLGITKNYRGITLSAIDANTLLFNRIRPEVDKILRKNQNSLRKNRYTASKIPTIY